MCKERRSDPERTCANHRVSGDRIGLSLSGGGFRAALFHAGALRRLNELGILNHPGLTTISSVSGGSITAALLACAFRWPLTQRISDVDWEKNFLHPLRGLTKLDIRSGPWLRALLPGTTGVDELAKRYDAFLGGALLADLPPEFVLCASDLAFGVSWEFRRNEMGSYQAGFVAPPSNWTVGRSVAVSSCFPAFQPLHIPRDLGTWVKGKARVDDGPRWDMVMRDLRLSDGGVYDNLGLEPIWADLPLTKATGANSDDYHDIVLVSDGGAPFPHLSDKGLVGRILRYRAIQDEQSRRLRRRWLIERFKAGSPIGAFWGIGSSVTRYPGGKDALGYTKGFARDYIARIRTDLDAFSETEAQVLENHGYLVADRAVRSHASRIVLVQAELKPPHPDRLPPRANLAGLKEGLAESRFRLLGRR